MVAEPREIILLSKARRALAEARTVDEVKRIRDKAEAVRMYAKAQGECLELQNEAAEVRMRAERKAGELLDAMNLRPGRRPSNGDTMSPNVRLADIGIEKKQSERWQRVASIPEETFTEWLEETKSSGRELTTAAALSLAKSVNNGRRNGETLQAGAASALSLESLVASDQRFGTIYADPPWKYSNQSTRASTDNHYPTMTPEELAALPVGELAAPQSHLWLWTTNGFLFECPRLFEAWGFTFKSSFVWVKPQMGIGNYLRNSHEFLLLAVRGGLTSAARDVMSWLSIPRTEHSAKPERIRREVVEPVSPGPRLELFGRRLVDGWTVYGNQIERTMFDRDVG